jgi:hypothetical protein
MKKHILIIATFICFNLKAQIPTPILKDTALNKYEGTWQWVNGIDTVTLILQKQVITMPYGSREEIMSGWHQYIRSGQLNQSSLQYIGQEFDTQNTPLGADPKNTLYGFTQKPAHNRVWFAGFYDLTIHKDCYAYLEMLPNSTTQAKWTIKSLTAQSVLPSNIVFTKQ